MGEVKAEINLGDTIMVDWKWIGIGAILVIILSEIFGLMGGYGFLGVLIATIILGYLVGGGAKNGAIYGIISGIIGGIIVSIASSLGLVGSTASEFNMGLGLVVGSSIILIAIISYAIIGAIGGAIGGVVKGQAKATEPATDNEQT